jgi:TBC domain-containing protein kinase-like protein
MLFKKLLSQYPSNEKTILKEARIDIPCLYRGVIWAALLGIKGDPSFEYEFFQNDNIEITDRQLDLDIPRCHQVTIH